MTACPIRGHDHDLTIMWTVRRDADGQHLSRLSCPKGYRFLRVDDHDLLRLARPRWAYPTWAEQPPTDAGLTLIDATNRGRSHCTG